MKCCRSCQWMCAAGMGRDAKVCRRSPLPPNNGRLLSFKPQGSWGPLLPLFICSRRLPSCVRCFKIVKECLRLCSIKINKKMRVEDGSGAVCCVQAKAFEFSCWESEHVHSFQPEQSRNGGKGPFGHDRCGLEVSHCPVRNSRFCILLFIIFFFFCSPNGRQKRSLSR